jgi:hypothetical protein
MMHRVKILVLFFLPLSGCGDDDGTTPGTDSGPRPGEDAGTEACTIPDTTCPADQPFAGSACDLDESCNYTDPVMMGGTPVIWTYTCVDSQWMGTSDCMPAPGGSCPVGPLAEGCRMPFTGMLTGATIELGPPGAGPFRPFMPDEMIELVVGGQGSAMIALRIRVDGEELPRCVTVASEMEIDGGAPQGAGMRPMVLHCGESLPFFLIVPEVCMPGMHQNVLRVTIPGIGTGTATVRHGGTPCYG